jgi:hypothetical protein
MTVIIDGTTGIVGATWATSGRPSSPVVGQRGFNTTINAAEIYNGAQWNPMSNGFSASGGTKTVLNEYTIHTFTSSGTFTPAFAGTVDYLVVAGGGGGGGDRGGGGGAGGFRTGSSFAVAATGLTVTIGAGGASYSAGNNSVFSSITSIGGGNGGGYGTSGVVGGSGSGGAPGGGAGGAGTSGQGYSGGNGWVSGTSASGGGGGGAGAAGQSLTSNNGGAGGAGLSSSFSGTATMYAGGGAGGWDDRAGGGPGLGGSGGGGNGGGGSQAGFAGEANTGGGGGAGVEGVSTGGAGGSGIVIIRYLTAGETSILPTVGTAGTVASVNMLQTRTQDSYTGATSGNGTVITPLNITFTPKQAGNKVILEFTVNGDGDQDQVFLVSRNDVFLADATNASNNRWAGVAAGAYDQNVSSTPSNYSIRILDLNTLATESTYKVQVRSSGASAKTFYLNRTANNSTGTDDYEATLSVVTATEIWA